MGPRGPPGQSGPPVSNSFLAFAFPELSFNHTETLKYRTIENANTQPIEYDVNIKRINLIENRVQLIEYTAHLLENDVNFFEIVQIKLVRLHIHLFNSLVNVELHPTGQTRKGRPRWTKRKRCEYLKKLLSQSAIGNI